MRGWRRRMPTVWEDPGPTSVAGTGSITVQAMSEEDMEEAKGREKHPLGFAPPEPEPEA